MFTVTILISTPWNDFRKEDLRIDVEEEGEEEKRDTGDEGVQEECVDYLSTLAPDLIEDRYYLDDDDSTDKFNSNRIDVCPWPNIDFVNSDINWKISNTLYQNDIENRNDYENGRFNHGLKNERWKIEMKSRDDYRIYRFVPYLP
ncbi:myb-like protein X [Vespula maculifrons]|uniref:Myb-like protein X n=1 Tax=Vespula maculifrons TaxID=7453 RepID=A0ABD2AHA7_VESMC